MITLVRHENDPDVILVVGSKHDIQSLLEDALDGAKTNSQDEKLADYTVVYETSIKSNWESAENSKYKIPYVDSCEKSRNYFPDFIIDDSIIVEVKPKNLITSRQASEKPTRSLLSDRTLVVGGQR